MCRSHFGGLANVVKAGSNLDWRMMVHCQFGSDTFLWAFSGSCGNLAIARCLSTLELINALESIPDVAADELEIINRTKIGQTLLRCPGTP